jgi:hypothetical protein
MFRLTCFVGLARFVTVALRFGEVAITLPERSSIVFAPPCPEILIGKAHDPNGDPTSTIFEKVICAGGVPFGF